jgi:5-methylcytosine-specific restriction endonuclease McrA
MNVTPLPKPHTLRSLKNIHDYRTAHPCCEVCGSTQGLQVHHAKTKGSGGGDEPDNLMMVCYKCHYRAHNEPGFKQFILRMKRWTPEA